MLPINKGSEMNNEIEATKSSPPVQIIICASPYDENEPPWESHLISRTTSSMFNNQWQSPIFAKLSPELRLHIFSYALAEYEDMSDKYTPEDERDATRFSDYYRPGWEAPWVIELALLYTCRRIYREASDLPMKLATHRFCFDVPRPRDPDDSTLGMMNFGRLPLKRLTARNLNNLRNIHIQTSLSWLQSSRKLYLSEWERVRGPDPFPNLERLTITIGWAHWFPYEPGEVDFDNFECDDWPEVKKLLRLEFEVATHDDRHERSIDKLIELLRAGRLRFETINGTPLIPSETRGTRAKWGWQLLLPEGVKDFDYTEYRIGDDHPNPVNLVVTAIDFIPRRTPVLSKGIGDKSVTRVV